MKKGKRNPEFFRIHPVTKEEFTIRACGHLAPEQIEDLSVYGDYILIKYPTDFKGPLYSMIPPEIDWGNLYRLTLELECSYHYTDTPAPEVLSSIFNFRENLNQIYCLRGYIDQLHMLDTYFKEIWGTDLQFDIMRIILSREPIYGSPAQKLIHVDDESSKVLNSFGLCMDQQLGRHLPRQFPFYKDGEERKKKDFPNYQFINIRNSSLWYRIDPLDYALLEPIEWVSVSMYDRQYENAGAILETGEVHGLENILFLCMEYPDHFFFDGFINGHRGTSVMVQVKRRDDDIPARNYLTFASEKGPTHLYDLLLDISERMEAGLFRMVPRGIKLGDEE